MKKFLTTLLAGVMVLGSAFALTSCDEEKIDNKEDFKAAIESAYKIDGENAIMTNYTYSSVPVDAADAATMGTQTGKFANNIIYAQMSFGEFTMSVYYDSRVEGVVDTYGKESGEDAVWEYEQITPEEAAPTLQSFNIDIRSLAEKYESFVFDKEKDAYVLAEKVTLFTVEAEGVTYEVENTVLTFKDNKLASFTGVFTISYGEGASKANISFTDIGSTTVEIPAEVLAAKTAA